MTKFESIHIKCTFYIFLLVLLKLHPSTSGNVEVTSWVHRKQQRTKTFVLLLGITWINQAITFIVALNGSNLLHVAVFISLNYSVKIRVKCPHAGFFFRPVNFRSVTEIKPDRRPLLFLIHKKIMSRRFSFNSHVASQDHLITLMWLKCFVRAGSLYQWNLILKSGSFILTRDSGAFSK